MNRFLMIFLLMLPLGLAADAGERFVHEEGYVRDIEHHLFWQDNKEVVKMPKSWMEARKYCADLQIAGMRGWRLPTEEELLGIVDFTVIDPAIYTAFKSVISDDYWTADRDRQKAQSVYFGSGLYQCRKAGKTTLCPLCQGC